MRVSRHSWRRGNRSTEASEMMEQPKYSTILYSKEASVATITLNRPDRLNTFTPEMNREIVEAFKAAEKDTDVRCIILTGAGKAFCAGEDLTNLKAVYESDQNPSLGEELKARHNPMILRIYSADKPVIAAVNGAAAGAGLSMALACDLRIASEKASFHEAFIRVGLAPDSGFSYFLPRLIGMAKAKEFAYFGEGMNANEAERLGIVNKVVPAEDLTKVSQEWASKLSQGATAAIGLTKRAFNRSFVTELPEALQYEAYLQEMASRTNDHREGVKAFYGKRQPTFKGA